MNHTLQNVLQALAVAAILYFGATVQDLSKSVIELKVTVSNMKETNEAEVRRAKDQREEIIRQLEEVKRRK